MEVCPFFNQTAQTLKKNQTKTSFKFIPSWTIQLLLPQWHRLEIKAGLMFGEDTEGSVDLWMHIQGKINQIIKK